MVQDVFNQCPSVLGVLYINNEAFVHFNLNHGYILESPLLSSEIAVLGPEPRNGFNYVIFSSKTKTVDDLLEVVFDVMQKNQERMEKDELFKSMMTDLKEIFTNNDLESLRTFAETVKTTSNHD